jgi:hypothetical protein
MSEQIDQPAQSGGHRNLPTINDYKIDASTVGENARKLLEEYSKIPADQVNDHVEKIVIAQLKVI